MTKKDYIKIASIIKDNTRIEQSQAMIIEVLSKDKLIDDLCIMFKKDNSLFDKQTFINACE